MRVEDSDSVSGLRPPRPPRLLLLLAAAAVSCARTCTGMPAYVWDPVNGAVFVDNQSYIHVPDLALYAPGGPSAIGSTFYVPWLSLPSQPLQPLTPLTPQPLQPLQPQPLQPQPLQPLQPQPLPSQPQHPQPPQQPVDTATPPLPTPPPPTPPPPTPPPPTTPTPTSTPEPPPADQDEKPSDDVGIHSAASGFPVNRSAIPDSILGYDLACGIRKTSTENRIVGGSQADPGEFPWQVSLQKKRWISTQHVCGGAIVSPFWVVTAGHCVDGIDVTDLSVVAGEHNLYKVEGTEQRRNVVRVVGLGYDKDTFANDIVLLQLDRRLLFNPHHVAPICVPRPTHHYRDGEAVVSGWGRLSENGGLPNTLHYVSLPLIPWPQCKRRYQSRGFSRFLHTCQICSGRPLGGQDSCQGDSGGPLACQEEDGRYYLCGIVSWGIGCARAEYPGVYTEVSCYARWINEVLYNEHHYLDPEKNKPRP